jgi:amino acid adenylation domain-containing protein
MTQEPIHEMFQRAAARFPDRVAVEGADQRATYRELEERSNALATALVQGGAEPGEVVAVLAVRTVEVIAAILAILKAGCAFAPFDRQSPAANLETFAAAALPRWWLVTPENRDSVAGLAPVLGFAPTLIPLGEGEPQEGGAVPPAVPARDPDGLAYVYFTSGSTGRPKGIAGRLKAIDHFIRWEVETFGVGEGWRVSQLTSPAFDAYLRDVFVPLVAGGTVCAPPGRETLLDGRRLAEWIDAQAVQLLHCTPSLFRSLLNAGQDAVAGGRFQALRHVLLAGEPLLPSDVRRWRALFGDRIELVNFYGPSETTMIKLFYRVRPEDGESRSIPIGQPLPGARAIVLDERGKPCQPGKMGEIYIRTPYRALGYFGQPELTREAFVPNPLSDRQDDIVYRTGDLGRLRDDGNLEFVGRRDQQVKVRGMRIEIAPIEELLRSHESVAEVAVVDRTDGQGNKFLCAYVVPRGEVDTGRLREHLLAHLSEAMVPSAFVRLGSLPRTLSGKVDRRALPDPGAAGGSLGRPYEPPRTPVEECLCTLFAELLNIQRVGIRDSFFELGGHSLLATLLLARVRADFGVELPLGQVFREPTVEGLAGLVVRLQMEQEEGDELAALLGEIQSLSDEALEETIRHEGGGTAGAGGLG